MSQLPQYYQQLRSHLATALNALDTYEKVCVAESWGVTTKTSGEKDLSAVKGKAISTVEQRLLALCEYAGVRSRQVIGLSEQINALQQENRWLTEALHRVAKKENV